jgi:uncharacterized protein (TIGR02391 family)
MSAQEAEAILKNQKRRGEGVQQHEFNSQGIADAEKRLAAWEQETDGILREMFDTSELAEEFGRAAALYLNLGTTEMARLQAIGGRVTYKNYALDEIIKRLQDYQQSAETKATDFWDLIHPAIVGVAKSRFDSGHYADCAETALKHINTVVKAKVKKRTGEELDGAALMNKAFSVKNPIITIDDISAQSGKDIQQGYMQIFAGAMIGIRNPKAHEVIVIDRERAIHFIFLASLLMHTLDMAS